MSKAFKAIGSIFTPKMPKIATARMPDPGSFASTLAAREEIADRTKKRGGRDSTILTRTVYSGNNLGGTA